MIASSIQQDSTSATTNHFPLPPEITGKHHPAEFIKFIIVGDDVKTAKSQLEVDEITLHMREQEILRQRQEAQRKEDLIILEKNKPKEKWYKQFQKHKKNHGKFA